MLNRELCAAYLFGKFEYILLFFRKKSAFLSYLKDEE